MQPQNPATVWPADTPVLRIADVCVDLRYRRLGLPEGEVELSSRVFDVLLLFLGRTQPAAHARVAARTHLGRRRRRGRQPDSRRSRCCGGCSATSARTGSAPWPNVATCSSRRARSCRSNSTAKHCGSCRRRPRPSLSPKPRGLHRLAPDRALAARWLAAAAVLAGLVVSWLLVAGPTAPGRRVALVPLDDRRGRRSPLAGDGAAELARMATVADTPKSSCSAPPISRRMTARAAASK